MIKCYFIDVANISSDLPRSSFSETEIERLADSILASDGLLRPLILKESSVEKYTVMEGHREYYAAVRAKEKDVKKAEMVNAFVINAQMQRSTIDQLNLLKDRSDVHPSEIPTIDRHTLAELLSSSIEQLLPAIAASISTQLQPIVSQVAEHQQLLALIKLDQIKEPNTESQKTPDRETPLTVVAVEQPKPDIKPSATTKSTTNRNKKPKTEDASPAQSVVTIDPNQQLTSPEVKSVKAPKTTSKSSKKAKNEASVSPIIPVVVESPQQSAPAVKSTKATKSTEAKKGSDALGSIDPTKSATALNLINTLSQDLLTLRMERSAVSKAIVKLVPNIIVKRNNQPEQKFDTWEDIIAAKITGLSTGRIQEIIDKLK
jgi:ParB-like chromosome segregation protein Spo0J